MRACERQSKLLLRRDVRYEHTASACPRVARIEPRGSAHTRRQSSVAGAGTTCRCSGRIRGPDRVCRAYRRGHQDGADEHQDEPGDARGDLERVASHRVAEDENAGQDG